MSSILSELKGQRSDSIAVLSRLYSKGITPITGTTLQNDITTNIENLIASLTSKGGRGTTCNILASIIISLQKTPEIEGRLYSIIDRLPALLESVATSQEESEGFLLLLDAIVSHGTEEMISRLTKILSKLTACACRLCEKEHTLSFGLSTLSVFAESRVRMLLNPSAASIRRVSLLAIDHTMLYPTAAHVLALQNSSETPENWMTNWVNTTAETVRVVQLLGIKINIDKIIMGKVLPMIPSNGKILKLHGSRKALAVERAVRGLCLTLTEMLHNGCSSGPTSVELTYLLPFFSSILTLNVDIQANDGRNSVENESGISPSDLKLVVTQIKVHTLTVLTALLHTQVQSVLQVSSALCRPLASILAGKDMQSSLSLSTGGLLCLSAAIRAFPTSIVRDSKSGVLVLIDLFKSELRTLTAVRSSVLTAGDSDDKNSQENVNISLVFETMEILLLHTGSALTVSMREEIEICVGHGLAILCKGVICPQQADRRMHRTICEKLRENPFLQGLFLRVAYAEVFTSQRDGLLSGNITILKRVCEIIMRQNNTNNNSIEAVRILLAIEMILNPSTISLPSIPSNIAAKKYLTMNTQNTLSFTNSNLISVPTQNENENEKVETRTEVSTTVSKGAFLEGNQGRMKRGREEEDVNDDEIDNKRLKKDEIESFSLTSDIGAAYKKQDSNKENTEKDDDDDDDDDSLPDIDIEADPEK